MAKITHVYYKIVGNNYKSPTVFSNKSAALKVARHLNENKYPDENVKVVGYKKIETIP